MKGPSCDKQIGKSKSWQTSKQCKLDRPTPRLEAATGLTASRADSLAVGGAMEKAAAAKAAMEKWSGNSGRSEGSNGDGCQVLCAMEGGRSEGSDEDAPQGDGGATHRLHVVVSSGPKGRQ